MDKASIQLTAVEQQSSKFQALQSALLIWCKSLVSLLLAFHGATEFQQVDHQSLTTEFHTTSQLVFMLS